MLLKANKLFTSAELYIIFFNFVPRIVLSGVILKSLFFYYLLVFYFMSSEVVTIGVYVSLGT